MTSSLLEGRPVEALSGVQEPRILAHPPFRPSDTSGDEICDFAARHGLVLDPWQRLAMRVAMGEKPDGRWSAFEVGVVVARQNGKGALLEARELGGLFLLNERLMVHTAHLFKTSHEAFLRVSRLVRDSPELMKRVHRIYSSPSNEGIELKNGNRLLFLARSGGSGRGFSGDWVCLDEAYDLPTDVMDALVPTMSARPNPQLWYMSSAGKESSVVLNSIRRRALAGDCESLAYMEWSAPEDADIDDRSMWALANPALGIRITEEAIARERAALSEEGFRRERLGITPSDLRNGLSAVWPALRGGAEIVGEPVYALAVADDRSWACVAAAGPSADGLTHVEYGEYRPGTAWVVGWLSDLASRRRVRVVVRPGSQAGSLIPELERLRVDVVKASQQDYAQACGDFHDSVVDRGDVRHAGQPALDVAVRAVKTRRAGDAQVWEQRNPQVDISPLEAVTLAVWGSRTRKKPGRLVVF